MCFKKTSKGPKAQEAANTEVDKRTAEQIAQIRAIYADPARQKQITDFQGAQRGVYRDQLDRAKVGSDRILKFALARQGVTGSSTDADQNANNMRTYLSGILEADRRAQGDAASLRAQDENQKYNLIQMANGSSAATDAAQLAANGLRAQIATGYNDQTLSATQDFFTRASQAYEGSLKAKGARDAQKNYGSNLYGVQGGYLGSGSYAGMGQGLAAANRP